jgi:hypothetical protein
MQSERRFSAFLGVVVTAPRARGYSARGYSAFSANYCRCVAHRSSRTRLQRVFRKLLSLCCTPLLAHAVTAFGDAPTLAECRPKFISVTAWRVRFRECSTSFIRFNPGENCYNQRPSFRSLHGGRDSGSVQLVCENCYKRKSYCVNRCQCRTGVSYERQSTPRQSFPHP